MLSILFQLKSKYFKFDKLFNPEIQSQILISYIYYSYDKIKLEQKREQNKTSSDLLHKNINIFLCFKKIKQSEIQTQSYKAIEYLIFSFQM